MQIVSAQNLFDEISALNVVDKQELETAFNSSEGDLDKFIDTLEAKSIVPEETIGKLIAESFEIPFVQIINKYISQEVLEIVPEIVAKKNMAIVFDRDGSSLHVAVNNPETPLIEFLKKKTGLEVKVFYALKKDIQDTFSKYNPTLEEDFEVILNKSIEEFNKSSNKDFSISEILESLIEHAYQNRASDVHIEPNEEKGIIRFRIDGMLHDITDVSAEIFTRIIARIKIASGIKTDEHMSAQDGRMELKTEYEDLDIRVSIVPLVNGEKAVLRLLSSKLRQYNLTDLGLNKESMDKLKKAYELPYGMILVTGPTGSGKTTTIYAVLKKVNSREVNIATIEDPVEYDIDGINQIQVNPQTNLTFAKGLRAILRQDPDMIFVGEIRDPETAEIAVNSAMTGHLVFSTLHTNDAATTLPRLMDMGVEPYLIASTVNIIVAQRLVRKICTECRTSKEVNIAEYLNISQSKKSEFFGDEVTHTFFEGAGCETCHQSGYNGRVGIFEILEVTSEIQELIAQKATADVIRNKAIEQGMVTMLDDGVKKVLEGETTFEELLRVTKL